MCWNCCFNLTQYHKSNTRAISQCSHFRVSFNRRLHLIHPLIYLTSTTASGTRLFLFSTWTGMTSSFIVLFLYQSYQSVLLCVEYIIYFESADGSPVMFSEIMPGGSEGNENMRLCTWKLGWICIINNFPYAHEWVLTGISWKFVYSHIENLCSALKHEDHV